MSCTSIGRPSGEVPARTVAAGQPVRLCGVVQLVGSIAPGDVHRRRAAAQGRRRPGRRAGRSARRRRASRCGRRPSAAAAPQLGGAELLAVGAPDLERELVPAVRVARLPTCGARRAQRDRGRVDRRDRLAVGPARPLSVLIATRSPPRSTSPGSPSGTGATPPSGPSGPATTRSSSARSVHAAGERADLRARDRRACRAPLVVEDAGQRDAARARLERGEPAEVRGEPDARAGVGAQPARRAVRRDDRRLAAAAPARRARQVVRVRGPAVHRVVGLDPAAVVRAVGLAEQDRAGRPDPRDRGRVAPRRRRRRAPARRSPSRCRRRRGCP